MYKQYRCRHYSHLNLVFFFLYLPLSKIFNNKKPHRLLQKTLLQYNADKSSRIDNLNAWFTKGWISRNAQLHSIVNRILCVYIRTKIYPTKSSYQLFANCKKKNVYLKISSIESSKLCGQWKRFFLLINHRYSDFELLELVK